MDLEAIAGVLMPHFAKIYESMRAGEPREDLDKNELHADLACLPDQLDEDLR
jgi:hypothetical protein